MRKYMASLAMLTIMLFALGAMAQTSGSYGQSTAPTTGSSSGQDQSTTTTTTTSQTTTSSSQQASMEGCVVQEQADFFLVPRQGSPIKLQATAGQDFSSHVGKRVKVSGNESSLSASTGMGAGVSGQTGAGTAGAPSTSAQASTSGGMAGATAGTSGTSGQAGAGTSGAVGAPSTGAGAGTGGTAMPSGSELHSMANRQIDVNNVSLVSSTCPTNWNPSVPSASGTSTPSQTPQQSPSQTPQQ